MKKKSFAAILMYILIGISMICWCASFSLYYGGVFASDILLWTGICTFMVVYHLWGRIILGNITKLFRVNEEMWWFRERPFEKNLYRALRVKKWKGKALTYNPDHFSMEKRTVDEVISATLKAELDHWVNEGLSLVSILFSLLWGEVWIFVLTAILAMLFDGQFILIQRYNRPRLLNLKRRKKRTVAVDGSSC